MPELALSPTAESVPTPLKPHAESDVQSLTLRIGSWFEAKAERTMRLQFPEDAELKALAEDWLGDTRHSSLIGREILHPAYQRIIGKGQGAVPFLLRRLVIQPEHWFHALWAITGADPVPEESRGDIEAMANAWLTWGKRHGFLRADQAFSGTRFQAGRTYQPC